MSDIIQKCNASAISASRRVSRVWAPLSNQLECDAVELRTCTAASCAVGARAWGFACACACAWALPAHCSGSGARAPGSSLPGALLVPSPA